MFIELMFSTLLSLSAGSSGAVVDPQCRFDTIDLEDRVIILRHQYKSKPGQFESGRGANISRLPLAAGREGMND